MSPYRTSARQPAPREPWWIDSLFAVGGGLFMAGLVGLLMTIEAGCTNLQPAVAVTNGARTAGHAMAEVVERMCTVPAERAATLPEAEAAAEVERLHDLGCPAAWHAQTDLAEAHRVMRDLVIAIDAGQCVATLARDVSPSCDIRAAAETLADAGARLGAAVERLERAR